MENRGVLLYDVLMRGSQYGADNIVLVYNNFKVSYTEFCDMVQKKSCILKQHGICKNSKVAIIIENQFQFILNFSR